jgi:phosphatidylserine/phosphatidylglycerophosphate/cardiolipin synthase-like enzyme
VIGLRDLMVVDRDRRTLPESITRRLIIGPERARLQFTDLLAGAESSIRIIDPKLSDPDLTALLAAKQAAGVAVEILKSRRLGDLKSHGKLVLVDNRIGAVGSLALAALSLDFRREVAITVESEEGLAEIARVFDTYAPRVLAARTPAAERHR